MRPQIIESGETRFQRTGTKRPPRKGDWFLPKWGSSSPIQADHNYPLGANSRREILKLLPPRKPIDRRVKATRSIVGITAKVILPCGCHALVCLGSYGGIKGHPAGVTHVSAHTCPEWKDHRYELKKAEEYLTKSLKKFYYREVKLWRNSSGR